jgi:hypothetical protein
MEAPRPGRARTEPGMAERPPAISWSMKEWQAGPTRPRPRRRCARSARSTWSLPAPTAAACRASGLRRARAATSQADELRSQWGTARWQHSPLLGRRDCASSSRDGTPKSHAASSQCLDTPRGGATYRLPRDAAQRGAEERIGSGHPLQPLGCGSVLCLPRRARKKIEKTI